MNVAETNWVLQNEQADEARKLRKNALFVGLSLLVILVVEVVAAALIASPLSKAEAKMATSDIARLVYHAIYSVYYCVMLLFPVGILALIFRRPARSNAPRERLSAGDAVLLIAFGMAFCVLSNYLVNYWLEFVSMFGVEPFEGDYHNTGGWLALVLNLFTYALLPGIVEELVFRGWILGSLRPFGERRALVLSALIFGLMHGNLTQLPFALLLGLLFGFLYLRTGRLWVGMVIHMLNNALSVVLDYINANAGLPENTCLLLQLASFVALAVIGTVAGLILRHRRGTTLTHPLTDHRSVVPSAQRARMMWLSPAVVAALVALLALTVLQEVVV